MSQRDTVHAALLDAYPGGYTYQDLAGETGYPAPSVRRVVSQLRRLDLAIVYKAGRTSVVYAIVDEEPEEPEEPEDEPDDVPGPAAYGLRGTIRGLPMARPEAAYRALSSKWRASPLAARRYVPIVTATDREGRTYTVPSEQLERGGAFVEWCADRGIDEVELTISAVEAS